MEPSQPSDAAVVVEIRDQRMFIFLNRPASLNAQNQELRVQLAAALRQLDTDDSIRVGLIVGVGGRAFSAGADLKEVAATERGRPVAETQRHDWIHFEAARYCSKPLLALIDGHCVGGGLELANYCDIRLATTKSTFGQPEPRTVGGAGGPALHQLPRRMPMGEALLISLTSRPMPAERAYQIGLIQRLCQDREALFAEADVIVEQMLECNPLQLKIAKRVIRWGADMTEEQAEKLHLLADEMRWDVGRA
ncbi:MAG: enoyl-CoA hydratase/isomerase family protein [Acidimicrobiia bacterium]